MTGCGDKIFQIMREGKMLFWKEENNVMRHEACMCRSCPRYKRRGTRGQGFNEKVGISTLKIC